jgi:hypothetical protein
MLNYKKRRVIPYTITQSTEQGFTVTYGDLRDGFEADWG